MYRKLKANQLFTGTESLDDTQVLILDARGKVEAIVPQHEAGEDIEVLEGILSPGFVNVHCHLELSFLKNQIPRNTGLTAFLTAVMQHKTEATEQVMEAMELAEREMRDNGIVAVGDISNTVVSIQQKQKNNLYYQTFLEVAGFTETSAKDRFEQGKKKHEAFDRAGLSVSMVPHAPYSVSEKLFSHIEQDAANKLLSIHNQEMDDENQWYMQKAGALTAFYQQWNISTDSFSPSGKSSLQTLLPSMNPSKPHILVHNVFTSDQDILAAKIHFSEYPDHLIFCLCPQANVYIQNRLPDLDLFMKHDCRIVFGTDSLASNHRLSVYDELTTLLKAFPQYTLEELLVGATSAAAGALQINHRFGSFEKGKQPGVVLLSKKGLRVVT